MLKSPNNEQFKMNRRTESDSMMPTNQMPNGSPAYMDNGHANGGGGHSGAGGGQLFNTHRRPSTSNHPLGPLSRPLTRDNAVLASGGGGGRPNISYKKKLKDLLEHEHLGTAEYNSNSFTDPRTRRINHTAKVAISTSVGIESYHSHPASCASSEDAEEEAARKAYDHLIKKKDLLKFGKAVAKDEPEIKEGLIKNICAIVDGQSVFHSKLPEMYFERFHVNIPENWLEIIENCDKFHVEKIEFSNGTRIFISIPKCVPKPHNNVPSRNVSSSSSPLPSPPTNYNNTPPIANHRIIAQLQPTSTPVTINTAAVNTPNLIVNNPVSLPEPSRDVPNDDEFIRSAKSIPKAHLPTPNPTPRTDEDYFDVMITIAASPYNFYVQDYQKMINENAGFRKMETEMQEFYDNEENEIQLHPDLIYEGSFMAAKFSDKKWNRVRVETILSRDPMQLVCYFVDYGDLHQMDFANMQPLWTQFRSLPMQAIKASLATVEPLDNDWDVMACYEFKKLVENKSFVATVYGITGSDVGPLLQISLCDTSNESDVFIDRILCERNYAKKKVPSF